MRRYSFPALSIGISYSTHAFFNRINFLSKEPSVAHDVTPSICSNTVKLRGRVHKTRVKGKVGFITLRQGYDETIQVVVEGDSLLETARSFTPESIIDVEGTVKETTSLVKSTSCPELEIMASALSTVSAAASPLPFPLHDLNTKLDTRLNHRVIDVRTPATKQILQLQSKVCQLFRNYLQDHQGFMEIHTPKMIATPSEGGSAVFKLQYFGADAYLAQSPQLYKQMALMGDCERVMEVGPVFRAENSLSHRHLTEFTGLDAEMIIRDDHREILDVLEGTMCHILQSLQTDSFCVKLVDNLVKKENIAKKSPIVISVPEEIIQKYNINLDSQINIRRSNPVSPSDALLMFARPADKYGSRLGQWSDAEETLTLKCLRLPFAGAVELLVDKRVVDQPIDDFTTAQEKTLGEIIKERYGVDIYIIDYFPASARPFYTMHASPDGASVRREERATLSFDMYLRGEEICSGGQRISSPDLMIHMAGECGVDSKLMRDYMDSFRYGAYPHGGFGLGLERIITFYLGLPDVRMASLFPRDPKRITP